MKKIFATIKKAVKAMNTTSDGKPTYPLAYNIVKGSNSYYKVRAL